MSDPTVSPLTAAAVVTTLLTVVGTLAKVLHAQNKEIEKRLTLKLDESEERRESQAEKLLEVSTGLGELKGQLEGHKQAREDITGITNLSGDVLTWMHGLNVKRKEKNGNSRADNTD